jgi:diaminohydroxyphosphoribosylaminopyrimidine deaminase/5-amino-6-(5-phosphoribosylamino)uracil reductase
VIGAIDPNPRHSGRGIALLRRAGIEVTVGILERECETLNEVFNHWIVHRTPYTTVKAAMTLDGKIATASGESKWITGDKARAEGMKLRQSADAVLVGIKTILADDPALTYRPKSKVQSSRLRRIILDSRARTPVRAKVVTDESRTLTTIVVGPDAPKAQMKTLQKQARVIIAPARNGMIDLKWLLRKLGREEITSLLVEGGGEVNASFLLAGLAQRVVFFYASKVLGGSDSKKSIAGLGITRKQDVLDLMNVQWKRTGEDLMLSANVQNTGGARA